jgi:hypothetical protein
MQMNFNFTHYFILDVESIGLHGEGYAAAYAVFDLQGRELEANTFACDPTNAVGDASDRAWVAKNVPPISVNCRNPHDIQRNILQAWVVWQLKGAALCADCTWPVESNFLSAAIAGRIESDGEPAKWLGPYPVIDISTLRMVTMQSKRSLPERDLALHPEHHPMADVRYSAKVLFNALLGMPSAK